MDAKHDVIFHEVVAACRAKHLRDVMYFQENWNNEIIAQFYATLYVEEQGGHEKVPLDNRGKAV
jgi:Leu/Phe-tRNA-protein transferase